MSKTNSQKGKIIFIALVIGILAGLIVIFEKYRDRQNMPVRAIPSKPVIKWIDPLLAVKGCLFDLGASDKDVEFLGDTIKIKLKDGKTEEELKKCFEPLDKIGSVEIKDSGKVSIIIDGHRWNVEIINIERESKLIPTPTVPFLRKARLAIIVDDMGLSVKTATRLAAIDKDISFSILPYTNHTEDVAAMLHSRGCDVLVHLPMEGIAGKDPGKGAILSNMTDGQVVSTLTDDIETVPYAVGVSNHMGSKITQDIEKMTLIQENVKERGLFYVDSMTISNSVCSEVARNVGIPFAKRDVFLDNELNAAYISSQFEKLKKIALKNGFAIGICHPHDVTIAMLEIEVPRLKLQGIELEPVSKLVKKKNKE